MNALNTAIYTTLTGGTALTSLLAGTTSVYYNQAPDSAKMPYVVYSIQGGGDTNETPSRGKNMLYFVRAYTQTSPAAAGTIDTQVDALLHGKTITVTGWSNWWSAREQDIERTENLPSGQQAYMAGGVYRIILDS